MLIVSPSPNERTTSIDAVDRPTPVDAYALPSQSDLQSLINRFFSTVGNVLPYVEKSYLFHDDAQSDRVPVWHTSKAGRALLNIICAHSAFTLRSPEAEIFYRRTLLLLDELALRGSSMELGRVHEIS